MPDMPNAGNIAFRWCAEFTGELYNNGLEHAVISPGSRSTPLTLALALHKGIHTHVILDERSAGFTALGIGKATGKPAVLVCTSGTAAANYYPAVIEARRSGTPLIVLTADRPPLLRNIGASQSMDQLKLYGDYPLFFFEAGEPSDQDSDLARLRILACQAWQESRLKKGPVHINFPFRKPLEPESELLAEFSQIKTKPNRQQPVTETVEVSEVHRLPDQLSKLIAKSKRPIIIDGPRNAWMETSGAGELSSILQAPLIAESTANGHHSSEWLINGFDALLRDKKKRSNLKPDLIVRFGYQPVSKGLEVFLEENKGIPHIHISDMEEWQDPVRSVTHRFNTGSHLNRIDWSTVTGKIDAQWTETWIKLSEDFKSDLDMLFKTDSKLTDGRVYYDLLPEIGQDWLIHLSNSFPVRDFDLFRPVGPVANTVLCNRGVSGIDGITSTAIGATMGFGKCGVLFTGDLAFLHDSNGLMSAGELSDDQTLIIVVINNNGGGIFRMLPIAEYPDIFEPYFVTPQIATIKNLCEAHHVSYKQKDSTSGLKEAFMELKQHPGLHVLECVTDPIHSMKQREVLWNRK